MNKMIAKTLIVSGVALSVLGTAYAADQTRDQNRNQTGDATKEQNRSMGQYVDDSTITAKVKAKHAEDKMVSAMRVSVETKQGVVMLSGEAKSEGEIQRAEVLAKQVEGVKSVNNMIELKPKS